MGKLIVFTYDMPKNVLISSREFCRHIPSYSTTQAALNKGCLHSLCWGVSLKQCVTCVTISNKGNVVWKFELKLWKKLAAVGYLTLFGDFKLAPMIKTYRSASCHQVLKIREHYIC